MVMLRNPIALIASYELGYYLGLTIHPDRAQVFYSARVSKVRSPAGYGTQIYKPVFSSNTFFKKLQIPLKLTLSLFHQFETLESFKNYLADKTKENVDILLCYDNPTLFDPENKDHWGHVCVLDKVDIKRNELRMIDPSPDRPKWINVKIDNMYEAMKVEGVKKSGGFWELSKI
jgi:hypothetical protein